MSWKAQINERGVITRYRDTDTGESLSTKEFERRMQMAQLQAATTQQPAMTALPAGNYTQAAPAGQYAASGQMMQPMAQQQGYGAAPQAMPGQMAPAAMPAPPAAPQQIAPASSPLIQPGAKLLNGNGGTADMLNQQAQSPSPPPASVTGSSLNSTTQGLNPSAGLAVQPKNLRLEGNPNHVGNSTIGYKNHGFLDATSIAILLPTLVLLALIIAAAHKKRLFPWQTIRTFNPPSGLMNPRDYERSYLCPPNLRRHGRLGKRNPSATWSEADGVVLPFGFLARTHLPITIPLGRLPNKNLFIVAPSGSGKTTLMRAIIKALLAKPSVIIALEAKANDPNLDEKREGFKYTILPEAQHAGFETLYFNPLDVDSIHWNPLDLDAISFASSIVQDVNSLPPEEQHWAERDHGYIQGLVQLLKWGAVQVSGEDENGGAANVEPLPCNPRGLMRLVNNRRNIVESLRRMKNNQDIDAGDLSEMTQTLSSIIRTDSDWDKNIQGVRGRLRMFKNAGVLRCTEHSNVDLKASMHKPTVLIFGAPASLGPDAESLASCFVYQLQQALHTRYGTKSVLPLFAFFDEYQTLNMDIAGRLSAIVRGANGGLTVILQNISQITASGGGGGAPAPELKTIFSNSAIRVCLHNADETTALFFSEEIGKHAVVVPGIADHYQANGFGIFPTSWNRIHSQQVVQRVDSDSIKRMEKHHALVYLAPAGDPEFGEVKPFMVDLRGIEEIARLHLLHNVQGRRPTPPSDGGPGPDGTSPENGPGPNGLEGVFHAAGEHPELVAAAGMAASAAVRAMQTPGNGVPSGVPAGAPAGVPSGAFPQVPNRACTACGKNPGKGKFCIECGSFVGASAAPTAPAVPAGQAVTQAHYGQQTEAVVHGAVLNVPANGNGQAAPPQFPTFAQPTASVTDPPAALRKASLFESPQQIADQTYGAGAYQAPGNGEAQGSVIQGAQRQPVTSFNLDQSRLGYQQQPAKGVKAGVEF